MKIFIAVLTLWPLSIFSQVDCDIFNTEIFDNISGVAVKNCLTATNVRNEKRSSQRNPESKSQLCGSCREDLLKRISIPENDKKKLKQEVYIESMYREYEKAMTSLMIDTVSIRKLYSTGSNFSKSKSKCSPNEFNKRINTCNSYQKDFLKGKDLFGKLSLELANILSPNPLEAGGILDRPKNSCGISDQDIIMLKPLLFENSLTPEIVKKILSTNVSAISVDEFRYSLGAELNELIKHHPLLSSLSKNPKELIEFFRPLAGINQKSQLQSKFREKIYTKQNGDKFDDQIAKRCEQSLDNLVSKVCSSNFEEGKISLGPFSEFNRFADGNFSEADLIGDDEGLLKRNFAMFEFCGQPQPNTLSIATDRKTINGWLPTGEQDSTKSEFSIGRYAEQFGTPKADVCKAIIEGCNDDSMTCNLFKLYEKTKTKGSPEYNLAQAPDTKVNSLLREFIGNSQPTQPEVRKVLIAEGILPQADGKFVERPDVPERKPEYLAGVANGTITPNTESSSSASAAASNSNSRGPQKRQGNSQLASIQPLQSGSAAAPEKVAENTSNDDSEDLRRFQDGLDERLSRAEGEIAEVNNNPKAGKVKRTPASKIESPQGIVNPSELAAVGVPAQTATASSEQTFNLAPAAPVGGKASLGGPGNSQALAQKQKNSALSEMSGAKSNPFAKVNAGSDVVNGEGKSGSSESAVALTLSGDIQTGLKKILESKDTEGANLRSLIEKGRPFKFELNNSVFNVQFEDGTCNVSFRSGDPSVGRELASTLQSVFNTTVKRSSNQAAVSQRNAKLGDLKNAVGN